MSEQHGATPGSNSPVGKDGRVRDYPIPAPVLPHYTLLLPNRKAKHRSTGAGIVWKYQLRYWQNRWYVVGRPRYRAIMKRIGIRK